MTIVVAYDGTAIARSACKRAWNLSDGLEEDVLVVTVIPNGNTTYARDRGWIDADTVFEIDTVTANLAADVEELCPGAEFEPIRTGRRDPAGAIANTIRKTARARDASMVVIGSENAGQIATAVTSVGGAIATDTAYDVLIVRR